MLQLSNLTARYGPIIALQDVDLEVSQGEIVALLGANGAGKSTLLRGISGLGARLEGAIQFESNSLMTVPAWKRVALGIAHVPEGRRVFGGLTVKENLEVAATPWKKFGQSCRSELEKTYELFPRLKEREHQFAWSMSGGEQQMLAIGRALMSKPRLLLLDEPSLGLAPLIAKEVYKRIKTINQRGVTVLLVEQNTALALSVASRAYVIENGKIVLHGDSGTLKGDPRVKEAYLGD